MTLEYVITIGDILTIIIIIISLVSLIYNIRNSNKIQKAHLLKDFVLRFNENPDLKKTFFEIEWGRFEVNLKTLPCSDQERRLTALIDFLDIVAYHEKKGILKLEDLRNNLGYFAVRLVNNKEMKNYFDWLDTWFTKYSKDLNVTKPSNNLRKLAEKLSKSRWIRR